MTTPPLPGFRVDRNARNDDEIHALLRQANEGRATPAGGTSFHDGVKAALAYVNGGAHPYTEQAPTFEQAQADAQANARSGWDQASVPNAQGAQMSQAPQAATAQPAPINTGPQRGPTGAGAAPTGAGGGGTGTTTGGTPSAGT